MFFFLILTYSFGQEKKLTPMEFDTWSNLYRPIISDNGQWAAWKIRYPETPDSLIVINTETKLTKKFKNTIDYNFSPDSKWIYNFQKDRNLQLIKLENEEQFDFPDLKLFEFSNCGKYAIIYDNRKTLFIINLQKEKIYEFGEIQHYALSPDSKHVLISYQRKENTILSIIKTENLQERIILTAENKSFKNFAWNEDGTRLAFLEMNKSKDNKFSNGSIMEYEINKSSFSYQLYPEKNDHFPQNTYIDEDIELFYGSKNSIYFYIRPVEFRKHNKDSLKNEIQIWNGTDKWIFPRKMKHDDPQMGPWLVRWDPANSTLISIASKHYPTAYTLPQENYAIISNPKEYEPSFNYFGNVDFYVKNLKTNKKTLFLENHPDAVSNKYPAPDGEWIAYYKDKDWWIYNIKTNSHLNVSENIPFELETTYHRSSNAPQAFGFAGWSPDGKWIFLYDEFDIWKISLDGKKQWRLTNGRDKNTVFRIYKSLYQNINPQRFEKLRMEIVDDSQELILETRSLYQNGYYILNTDKTITPLYVKNKGISGLKISKESSKAIILEESYNLPPRIKLLDENESLTLFQSNPHYKNLLLPKQELISYPAWNGNELKGILMYPDDYEEGKKYPMIVHVYEQFSEKFYEYKIPSLYNAHGFNPKIYTGNGYFVLFPDIMYEMGNPGISALRCVESAVMNILDTGKVDPKRIGLQGHSFGGYETAFIATQSDLFAAIVSSAGVTNFLSFYNAIGGITNRPNHWWFEHHQWRMGTSYFENIEGYRRNSPIEHVQNVKTPILLWSGENDVHIDIAQNIEFYLALRRLKKDVTFVVYPKEGHALLNPSNQIDLSIRMFKWFENYLKPPAFYDPNKEAK